MSEEEKKAPETVTEEKKEGSGEEAAVVQKKTDIVKLLSIIPPASELKRKETRIREKRVRVKWDESIPLGQVRINKELAEMLGIKEGDDVEIVIAGRHKFVYKAVIIDEPNRNIVYTNPAEMREEGVADNSIATIRRARGAI